MKGIVFTEFFEMVEEQFGLEMLDNIIERSKLSSGGVYTAIGTYDFFEMQELIVNLSKETNIPVDKLIYTYGLYFFKVLTAHHPNVFKMYASALEMLASIENHIHVQVRKIYPGAELPTFKIEHKDDNSLEMLYFSERSMYMFARALMEKTFEHYDEGCSIKMQKLNPEGTQVLFKISKQPNAYHQN